MRALLEHGRSVFRLRLSLSLLVRRGPSLMVRGGPKSHALLACHNRRRMIRASCVHSIGYGFPRCRILSGLFFRVSGPMPDMYPHDPAKFLRRGQGDSAPSAQASSFRHRLQRDQVPVEVLLRIAGMLTRLPAKISQPVDGGHANGHPAEFQSCNVPHPARRAAQTPGRSRRKRRHSFPPRIISLFPFISCLFCACMKAPVGTSDRRFHG